MIDREQEEALEFIEKRNRTFELYDQVRRSAVTAEKRSGTAEDHEPYQDND